MRSFTADTLPGPPPGAEPEEIALTNSATQGIGLAATGLNLAPGDEVVVASTNFPSNLFTWLHLRRRDVRVSVVEPGATSGNDYHGGSSVALAIDGGGKNRYADGKGADERCGWRGEDAFFLSPGRAALGELLRRGNLFEK